MSTCFIWIVSFLALFPLYLFTQSYSLASSHWENEKYEYCNAHVIHLQSFSIITHNNIDSYNQNWVWSGNAQLWYLIACIITILTIRTIMR